MSKFKDEYLLMMNELEKVVVAFKGYNGSKEHMKKLDDCLENGKKVIIGRQILSEDTIHKTFGIVREMIIKRQKAKSSIVYLEKCIAAEKQFITSLNLEKATIQAMKNIVSSYDEKVSDETLNEDDLWDGLINEVTQHNQTITKNLDHNELSHEIHASQIREALLLSLTTIEEKSKNKKT